MKGKVKWFNRMKGYGFIEPEEGEDVFVHHTSIEKGEGETFVQLNEGDEVEFDVEESPKGPQAKNVKKL
ncbi:MAG: cold-shock protein [Candidatus Aenigmarchaeota archaeon]|nr:cold-shock protein [Candidatus Aenigmarchaeota archaeon]